LYTADTAQNFTAGIAGFLSSFPADKRPSGLKNDLIASSEPLATPIGMTIALAAIWSGQSIYLISASNIPLKADFM
jgi:long-chain acyl-CoA synthetase